MLTIKKGRERIVLGVVLSAVMLWGGCKPPGVRAFLKGEKLLQAGDSEAAVAEFTVATRLLPTNALAWNYLGLAYHRSGRARDAHEAYGEALSLNPELAVAHYNLGCLYLEQNNATSAIEELTSYTLREPRSLPGWLKLGDAFLLSDEAGALSGSYEAYQKVLELEPGHPRALNGLGLMEMKRDRPSDALVYFKRALSGHPDDAKALLNLAIVAHEKLNNNALALESYKKYLALEPRLPNWEAVAAAARDIELEIEGVGEVSVAAGQALEPVLPDETNRVAQVDGGDTSRVARAELDVEPGVGALEVLGTEVETTEGTEAGVLPAAVVEEAAVVQPAQELPVETVTAVKPEAVVREPSNSSRLSPVTPKTKEARSFVSRLAPRVDSPPRTVEAPGETEPAVTPEPAAAPVAVKRTPPVSRRDPSPALNPAASPTPILVDPNRVRMMSGRRYVYLSPPRAAGGNRAVAERHFREGVKAQKDRRFPAAVLEYRKATQADPSYFEAFYNQGLAALQLRDWKQSLAAYEYALAQKPDSSDARYNFALALQEGGYQVDAAAELSKLIAQNQADVRSHLSLAGVYAKLGQLDAARSHYERVLALSPSHPQAGRIRSWLAGNR